MALDEDDKWVSYIRILDENIAANAIWTRVQKRLKEELPSFTSLEEHEKIFLKYLEEHDQATTGVLCRIAGISYKKASASLVNLVCLKVIDLHITKQANFFTLHRLHN